MDRKRVVELTFGRLSRGSGYLLTDRHVLTARHVVKPDELGAPCDVFPLLADKRSGAAAWLSEQSDLAIIEVDPPGWPDLPPASGCFGVVQDEAIPLCSAIGFPDATRPRESYHQTLMRVDRGGASLNVRVDGGQPIRPECSWLRQRLRAAPVGWSVRSY